MERAVVSRGTAGIDRIGLETVKRLLRFLDKAAAGQIADDERVLLQTEPDASLRPAAIEMLQDGCAVAVVKGVDARIQG